MKESAYTNEYRRAKLVLVPKSKTNLFYCKPKVKAITKQLFNEAGIEVLEGKITDEFLKVIVAFPMDLDLTKEIVEIKKLSSEMLLLDMPELGGENFWAEESLLIPIYENMEIKFREQLNDLPTSSKCLVTGGAGFIGSNLVDALIEAGNEVAVVDDLSSGKRDYLHPKAKFYEVDISDADRLEEIFKSEKFDFVFHLAAQIDVRVSTERPHFDIKINVLGSLNVLQSSHNNKVKKFVFISTGGAIYGDERFLPSEEAHPTYPLSPYGINKLAFEKYLNYYHQVFGQDYIILRLANVYGPRQYKGGEAGVVSVFVDRAVNDEKLLINGDGLQTRDYVYVGDVVSALLAAMKSDFVGEINISTGKETNLLEIIRSIELALDKSIETQHMPPKAGEQRRSVLDNSRAREILGWQPQVGLEEGIHRTIEWAQGQNNK